MTLENQITACRIVCCCIWHYDT